jgi:hypothetical protein
LSQFTVCTIFWKVHVTEPVPLDLVIVTVDGLNASEAAAVTLPVAEGVLTAIDCDPVCVTLATVIEAVIVEDPFATPVTTPVAGSTVAAAVFDDVHVAAGAPANVAPDWSFAVAVSVVVLPTETVGDAGATATEVNTGVGPVELLSLPPHAKIAAAILPAAIMRTTLRSMTLAPREGFLD